MFSTSEVLELIKAHKSGDDDLFDATIQKLAKNSEIKGRMQVAKALREIYTKPNDAFKKISYASVKDIPSHKIITLDKYSTDNVNDVILSKRNRLIVDEIIVTWNSRKKLKSAGLSPSTRILLHGLPGTGKTLLANAIGGSLSIPVTQVDVSKLISSFLGETAKNVSDLFSGKEQQILFLDEFESLAKTRADEMDIGEAKRIVTSILQNIDNMSEDVLLIAATNHLEMIDGAIRRRFTYEINMDDIDFDSRKQMCDLNIGNDEAVSKEFIEMLARLSSGFTGHDIHRIYSKAKRRSVLGLDNFGFKEQILKQLAETKYKKIDFDSKNSKQVKDLLTLIDSLWSVNKKHFTYDVLEGVTGIPHATINYLVKKEKPA